MKTYTVTLRHDKGKVHIRTMASSRKVAVELVLAAERAPESAVVKVTSSNEKLRM